MMTKKQADALPTKTAAELVMLIGVALILAGCPGGSVQGAMDAYTRGDMPAAAAECKSYDYDGAGLGYSARSKLRFEAYCGLVFYKRGERDAALALLASAKRKLDELRASGEPTYVGPEVIADIDKALATLKPAP